MTSLLLLLTVAHHVGHSGLGPLALLGVAIPLAVATCTAVVLDRRPLDQPVAPERNQS